MSIRVPPARALQVFESAARHLSFKSAAEELCLSQSAVSRQIQALEERLGVQLFERMHRTVALTHAGRELAQEAIDGFGAMRRVIERLTSTDRQLRLSVAPLFAAEWLMPRLPDFKAAHPEVELELVANGPLGDDIQALDTEQAEGAILHGMEAQWGDFASLRLLPPFHFVPVCAPGLIQQSLPLEQPRQLADYPWLINQHTPWVWDWYLQQIGAAGLEPTRKIHCDAFYLYKQALLLGQGISVAPGPLVYPLLQEGKLIIPYGRWMLHPSYNYYFIWREHQRPKPALQQFRRWLESQIEPDWGAYVNAERGA